ncbi:CLUMA_CG010604, isoform A [Clunio marinus]|uniref:CLUMA_CG010604, isoform A n=1 Tax=Clunio marinus TaxID=568069 RepID=A0A1J1IA92_9DIPT|nr:CLUMA_CG010604, isoform A [Clunio marinus]
MFGSNQKLSTTKENKGEEKIVKIEADHFCSRCHPIEVPELLLLKMPMSERQFRARKKVENAIKKRNGARKPIISIHN